MSDNHRDKELGEEVPDFDNGPETPKNPGLLKQSSCQPSGHMPGRGLVEVDKPVLFEHIFPYDEPPRIMFGDFYVSPYGNIQDRSIVGTDTTFRDGQ